MTSRFLSTPSARRATSTARSLLPGTSDFYPRPPRGGRRKKLLHRAVKAIEFLSTPSARRATHPAGGAETGSAYFYPRPPRGGRRPCPFLGLRKIRISIHALREEGDARTRHRRALRSAFLSTPSARRATSCKPQRNHHAPISIHALREEGDARPKRLTRKQKISIHALREEGDAPKTSSRVGALSFLSTPSARRATGFLCCYGFR